MRLTAYACSLGVVLALLLISVAQAATESTVYALAFPAVAMGCIHIAPRSLTLTAIYLE